MESKRKSDVYAKNVVEFVAVASEFCHVVESASQYNRTGLVDHTRKLLPLLYFKASLLPDVSSSLDESLEKYVTELEYNLHLDKWMQKLDEYDAFYEVFDPDIQFGSETVTASISENILDIYQDLKDFLTAYSLGDEDVMHDALAECRDHFRDFWGQRLVNVLRALHQLYALGDRLEEERGKIQGNRDNTHRSSNWVDRFFDQE